MKLIHGSKGRFDIAATLPIIRPNADKGIMGLRYDESERKLKQSTPLFVRLRNIILRRITKKDEEMLNKLLKLTPAMLKHPENKILTEKLISYCDELHLPVYQDQEHIAFSYYVPGNPGEIHISQNPVACVFAHELGHAMSWNGLGKTSDRISNKLYPWGKIINALMDVTMLWSVLGFLSTSSAGLKGTIIATLPYMTYSPVLHQEKAATNLGMKLMKDMGASDEYLALAKATQDAAYHTYKVAPIGSVILTALGAVLGLGVKYFSNGKEVEDDIAV